MEYDLRGCDALVLAAAPERSADLRYATGFLAPDPVVYAQLPGETLLLVSDLEVDRARAQADVDRVVSTSVYEQQLKAAGNQRPDANALLLAFLRELGVQRILVPADMAVGTADSLRQAGIQVETAPAPLFPRRQVKQPDEIAAVRAAMVAAEAGLEAAMDALRRAAVRDGFLVLDGQPLTSERLRRLIHVALIEQDYAAAHTIVAGGDQGCDPHQPGHGPLAAGQTIILDVFPQSLVTGYFGDITRTVVKGPAPAAVQRLYRTVLEAQELGLAGVAAGVDGTALHRQIQEVFTAAGYQTGQVDGRMQGFFHGTGHGVGLEIHEAPRIGPRGDVLQAGQIVTVEPGLYYRGVGGVRIEDTVVVRDGGCENLTSFPKFLEL